MGGVGEGGGGGGEVGLPGLGAGQEPATLLVLRLLPLLLLDDVLKVDLLELVRVVAVLLAAGGAEGG